MWIVIIFIKIYKMLEEFDVKALKVEDLRKMKE